MDRTAGHPDLTSQIYRHLGSGDDGGAVSVILELRGETCDIDCLYCYEKRKEAPGGARISADQVKRLPEVFPGRSLAVELHGGEPLTAGRGHVAEVLRELAAQPQSSVSPCRPTASSSTASGWTCSRRPALACGSGSPSMATPMETRGVSATTASLSTQRLRQRCSYSPHAAGPPGSSRLSRLPSLAAPRPSSTISRHSARSTPSASSHASTRQFSAPLPPPVHTFP